MSFTVVLLSDLPDGGDMTLNDVVPILRSGTVYQGIFPFSAELTGDNVAVDNILSLTSGIGVDLLLATQNDNNIVLDPAGTGTINLNGPIKAGLTNGQLLIGSTGNALVASILQAGTGITIANGAGSINVALSAVASGSILSNISGSSGAPTANTLTQLMDSSIGSTQGSLAYRNASTWVALTPGTSGQVLTSGGASANPSWATNGSGTVTSLSVADLTPLFTSAVANPSSTPAVTFTLTSQSANSVLAGPTSGAAATPTFRTFVLADLPSIANNTLLSNISGSSADPAANTLTQIMDSSFGNTQGSVLYRNATTWTVLTPGTAGQVLASGGASANLSWTDNTGGSVGGPGSSTLNAVATWGNTAGTSLLNTALTIASNGNIAESVANVGGTLSFSLTNTNNSNAASSVSTSLAVGGSSAGDAFYQALVTGGATWSWGVDNSDSDAWVLAASAALGTTNVMRFDTSGNMSLPLGGLLMSSTGARISMQSGTNASINFGQLVNGVAIILNNTITTNTMALITGTVANGSTAIGIIRQVSKVAGASITFNSIDPATATVVTADQSSFGYLLFEAIP